MGLNDDENIFHWKIMIIGPSDTPYEGGFFPAKLEFPDDFPNSPPVMTFTGPMLHPNGTDRGTSLSLSLSTLSDLFS